MKPILDALNFSVTVFGGTIVLFLILWTAMTSLFWKPFLSHLTGRDKAIEDAYKAVEATRHEISTLRSEYQERMQQVEAEARTRIQVAIKEAQAERERIVAETRAETDAMLKQGTLDMEREKTEALTAMHAEMVGLAASAIGKALGTAGDQTALRRSLETNIANAAKN